MVHVAEALLCKASSKSLYEGRGRESSTPGSRLPFLQPQANSGGFLEMSFAVPPSGGIRQIVESLGVFEDSIYLWEWQARPQGPLERQKVKLPPGA